MTARQSKILLLDGHERAFATFRKHLIRQWLLAGHEVHCAAPAMSTTMATGLREAGARPHSFDMSRTGRKPLGDLRAIRSLHKLLGRVSPDIALAYGPKTSALAGLASRGSHLVFLPVVTGLGFAFDRGHKRTVLGTVQSALYRLAYARSRFVIFQNQDDADLFTRKHLVRKGTRCVVVPGSGVPLDEFCYQQPPPTLHYLFVGRMMKSKGVREFIEAAKLVGERNPDAEFTMVGWLEEGHPDSLTRAELARSLEGSRVHYMGHTQAMVAHLQACSVFVLPSYGEGTPRSTLEAMAIGRAVITADVPGCRDTVEHGRNGYLVRAQDSHDLARHMLIYSRDSELLVAHGQESRRIAESRYDVRLVNRQMEEAVWSALQDAGEVT